jgi:hypothetical protein
MVLPALMPKNAGAVIALNKFAAQLPTGAEITTAIKTRTA